MRLISYAFIGLVLALAGYLGVRSAMIGGAFANLEPRLVENCARIEMAPGPEDVTFDGATGLAYISASDRRAIARGDAEPGGIYLLDPADPSSLRLVSTDAPADFQPHGIHLWRGADGPQRLFVVSHPSDGRQLVEIFDVEAGGDLAHAETVAFDAMTAPNDVAAVGPRAFYVSNDHGFARGFMRTVEEYLALPVSSVAFYDGTSGRIVRGGLRYANGVNISADGGTVYVAEILGRGVGVYARDAATGDLTRTGWLGLNTMPDNVELGPDGSLWIGAQPRAFAFLDHARDAAAHAPAQIIRVDPQTGESETVFLALDGEINAAAAGAVHDGRLIVGAIFDPHVMICPLAALDGPH